MKGQSKLIFINKYIWDQPWFIELDEKQKLAYFYIHLRCSDLGIYLHSEKAMENNIGYSYTIDEITDWMNKKRDMMIKLDDDTLLFQWFLKDHSKRGTKIKPISNPDLGKVREAIDSNVLDYLIENGTFHQECKLFCYGITESIIENTVYSAKTSKNKEYSDYDEMLNKVKSTLKDMEGLGKAFDNNGQSLVKGFQNVLNQSPSIGKRPGRKRNNDQRKSLYEDIATGFKFDCPEFLEEEDVRKEIEAIQGSVDNATDWIREQKEKFIEEKGKGQDWGDFVVFFNQELERIVE